MLSLRRSEQLRASVYAACRKCLATQIQPQPKQQLKNVDKDYVETPEYPEILDLSFRSRKKRQTEEWYQQIRSTRTVEEKLIKINMPRYYGYKVVQLNDDKIPYNCLPAVQHYTRTVFETSLPTAPPEDKVQQTNAFVQALMPEVQEAIEYVHDFFRFQQANAKTSLEPQESERAVSQLIVEQINRAVINVLAADFAHLQEIEVDQNPRHEAFWFVGGIDPPKNVVRSKEGRKWQKEMANDPVDRLMQYTGQPFLSVRHRHQLSPWKSEAEVENAALAKELPRFSYDPRTLGYVTGNLHGTNIPGFWPGSVNGFGCISYQPRSYNAIRPASYGVNDFKESLHAQAIQTSFAWLLAQANYNGFNTVTELSYPMNTQTIITNGRDWSFYEYQLNTLLMHSHHIDENPRLNFCRGTDELQLYQEINDQGKCIGLNDKVLRHLIQFYANIPSVQRAAAQLQPYLSDDCKRIADYQDVEQRSFLERVFKHMSANRPRHLELPEIYLWEKIYKIDHKTRSLEARRRFFELNINPWKRTMDQHHPEYIPRAVRPEGPKSKKRWKPTYYP